MKTIRFDEAAAKRIGDAVREAEARSAAEIVVEVRGHAGSYAHADARFGALLAFLSLVLLVLVPVAFRAVSLLLDAVFFYFIGVAISGRSKGIRRLMTRLREREAAVAEAAAARFHQRGIANTSSECGLLLFASILERRIEVLADRGVLRAVRPIEWNRLLASLRHPAAVDPETVVRAIEELGVVLVRDFPIVQGDVDELADEPSIDLG
jgi:putative membrane protein